jgi:hypothetical protein
MFLESPHGWVYGVSQRVGTRVAATEGTGLSGSIEDSPEVGYPFQDTL